MEKNKLNEFKKAYKNNLLFLIFFFIFFTFFLYFLFFKFFKIKHSLKILNFLYYDKIFKNKT